MKTNYWINKEAKRMIKIISKTEVDEIQVFGRDLRAPFNHSHRRVTYPTAERMREDIIIHKMEEGCPSEWESLMNEYLAVNLAKRDLMNEYRQKKYNNGELKL